MRLCFVLVYPQYPPLLADDDLYDHLAWNIATGRGFERRVGAPSLGAQDGPEVAVAPGYPAFLAGVYSVTGRDFAAVRMTQAIVGALTVLLCYLMGRDGFGARAGLIAGTLAAVTPALIAYTGMLLTETLFAFGIALSIWLAIRAFQTSSTRWWVLTGLALGLTVLVREEVLLLALLIVGTIAVFGTRQKVRHATAFLLAFAITVGLWTARNYAVFDRFILVSANAGQTVWISTMGWDSWNRADPEFQRVAGGLDYLEASDVLMREGLRNIAAEPLNYFRLCLRRGVQFWTGSHTTYIVGLSDSFGAYAARGEYTRVALKAGFLVLQAVGLLLAACGFVIALRRGPTERLAALLVAAPVFVIATVHFFLFSTSRYQVPTIPLLLVFAGVALASWNAPAARPAEIQI